jgi:hypothetical protein
LLALGKNLHKIAKLFTKKNNFLFFILFYFEGCCGGLHVDLPPGAPGTAEAQDVEGGTGGDDDWAGDASANFSSKAQ